MKEIKDTDLFYVRHEWFRDLCFYSSFYQKWLSDLYESFLRSKYFVVIQKVNGITDYQWLIHDGIVTHYNNTYGNGQSHKANCLTELLMHFDVKLPNDNIYSRRIYEITGKEYNNIRMVQEMLR